MNKIIITVLSVIIMLVSSVPGSFAVNYIQPFESGTENSDTFRIPSVITLNNGSVLAAADMRYAHGTDAPNNIDTLAAVSDNGIDDWRYNTVNHFDDYADGTTDSESASFIDSALVQSESIGRVFMITDAFPSGNGYNQALKGSGCIRDKSNILRLALSDKSSQKISDYKYYIGDFNNGFAAVDGCSKNYSVDEEFNLYLDGEPLYITQKNSDKVIRQNIFYSFSQLHVYPTSYLWLRYSDDNGATWSSPKILNSQVKAENEKFLGIGPGRGTAISIDGHERIIFTVYNNKGVAEHTSTVYSDDNGLIWKRGKDIAFRIGLGKTSEAQIISCPDGTLKMFARNASNYIASCLSNDGGVTWTTMKAERNLRGNANCMVSFINTEKTVNGKSVVLGSFVPDVYERADGIIKTGLMDTNGSIDWLQTYHVDDGFFAYSCLTELADGKIGYLYEDEAAHIQYKIFQIEADGKLKDINNDDIQYTEKPKGLKDKIIVIFEEIALFLHIL